VWNAIIIIIGLVVVVRSRARSDLFGRLCYTNKFAVPLLTRISDLPEFFLNFKNVIKIRFSQYFKDV
jgi:hypothetical protein